MNPSHRKPAFTEEIPCFVCSGDSAEFELGSGLCDAHAGQAGTLAALDGVSRLEAVYLLRAGWTEWVQNIPRYTPQAVAPNPPQDPPPTPPRKYKAFAAGAGR